IWKRFPIAEGRLRAVMEGGEAQLGWRVRTESWSFVADPEQRQAMVELNMRSAINVPIRGGAGRSFGVMSFARTRERPYEALDVVLAEELARHAAAAIERSRLYTAERTQRERLEHLQALSSALARAITTEEVLDALVAEMGDLI